MIHIDNISFTYTDSNIPVFNQYNWDIQRSEAWAVIGPSGCGKTTLLYMLAGLLTPNSGTVLIDQDPILRPRPKSGLILQDYGLLPWATVRENCELGLKIRSLYGADGIHAPRDQRLFNSNETWLEQLGLEEFADKFPGQLSGGQRQRVAIARTLNLEPDLLLMDEPFSSLDVSSRENLQDLSVSLVDEFGITLVLVTHSIEEAVFLGRKILVLKKPPNEKAIFIDNSEAGNLQYRNTPPFLKLCQILRSQLGTI